MSDPGSGNRPHRQAPDVVGADAAGDDVIDARPRAVRGILVGVLIALAIWICLLLVLVLIGVF